MRNVVACVVLASVGEQLSAAHRDSFASYLALTKAQAISYDAAANSSRYLLGADPAYYRQDFARKSDCLVKGGACGAGGDELGGGLEVLASGPGTTADQTTEVLNRWLAYQRVHEQIATLADSGQQVSAIDVLTGIGRGDAAFDFFYYDAAVSDIAASHKQEFEVAMRDVQGTWQGGRPSRSPP